MEKEVRIRKHHVGDIMKQVSNGAPDSIPAYVPKGIRDANTLLVNSILNGAQVIVVENESDAICIGCPLFQTCDFKDY